MRSRASRAGSAIPSWSSGSVELRCSRQGAPTEILLGDFPSARETSELAAAELGRLSPLGEMFEYPVGCYQPDLRVCPSQLIAKPDRIRIARYWPDASCGLNQLLINPDAGYSDMGGFSQILFLGPHVARLDFQDCDNGFCSRV